MQNKLLQGNHIPSKPINQGAGSRGLIDLCIYVSIDAEVRVKAEYMHIILRGTNKQTIFKEEEDKVKFIQTLSDYREKSRYKIYA